MTDDRPDSDEALGNRLSRELPRYTAPARLRVSIVAGTEPKRRPAWLVPLVSAAATALVFYLGVLPLVPRATPADPTLRLARAVVSEHARALMWGARKPEIYPAALSSDLWEEAGVSLARVFVGDDQLLFVAAEPVYIERQRGIAVHYRDGDGHLVTYVALPAPGVTVPERLRIPIEKWRPALVRDSGFATLVWKQGDIACFLVADMVSEEDLARFRDYFVRVRSGTEPSLPN
ncbi:MAG: hypothetical protein ACRELS_17235 [Candidatus Rokuibacteriota bacterium]